MSCYRNVKCSPEEMDCYLAWWVILHHSWKFYLNAGNCLLTCSCMTIKIRNTVAGLSLALAFFYFSESFSHILVIVHKLCFLTPGTKHEMWLILLHYVHHMLLKHELQVVGRYTFLIVQFKSYMLVHSTAFSILAYQLKGPLLWPVHCVSTTASNDWSELLGFYS